LIVFLKEFQIRDKVFAWRCWNSAATGPQ